MFSNSWYPRDIRNNVQNRLGIAIDTTPIHDGMNETAMK